MGQVQFEEFKEKYVDPNPRRVLLLLLAITLATLLIFVLLGGTAIGGIVVIIDLINPKVYYEPLDISNAKFQSFSIVGLSVDFDYPVVITHYGYFDIHLTQLSMDVYRDGTKYGDVVNTYDVWIPPYTPSNFTLTISLSTSLWNLPDLTLMADEYVTQGYISFDLKGDVFGDYIGVWFTRHMANKEQIDVRR